MVTHSIPLSFLTGSPDVRRQARADLIGQLRSGDPAGETALAGYLAPVRPPILRGGRLQEALERNGWEADLANHTVLLNFNCTGSMRRDEDTFLDTGYRGGDPGMPGIAADPVPGYAEIRRVVPELPPDEDLMLIRRLEAGAHRFRLELGNEYPDELPLFGGALSRLVKAGRVEIRDAAEFVSWISPGKNLGPLVECCERHAGEGDAVLELWLSTFASRARWTWDDEAEYLERMLAFLEAACKGGSEATRRLAVHALGDTIFKSQEPLSERAIRSQRTIEEVAEADSSEVVRAAAVYALADPWSNSRVPFDLTRAHLFLQARLDAEKTELLERAIGQTCVTLYQKSEYGSDIRLKFLGLVRRLARITRFEAVRRAFAYL